MQKNKILFFLRPHLFSGNLSQLFYIQLYCSNEQTY